MSAANHATLYDLPDSVSASGLDGWWQFGFDQYRTSSSENRRAWWLNICAGKLSASSPNEIERRTVAGWLAAQEAAEWWNAAQESTPSPAASVQVGAALSGPTTT